MQEPANSFKQYFRAIMIQTLSSPEFSHVNKKPSNYSETSKNHHIPKNEIIFFCKNSWAMHPNLEYPDRNLRADEIKHAEQNKIRRGR